MTGGHSSEGTSRTAIDRRELLAAIGAVGGSALAGCTAPGGSGGLAITMADDALLNEKLSIEISGLEAGGTVDVRARTTDADGGEWESTARFVANDEGVVSVPDQAPEDGDYDGAHPMGLLWSMTPTHLEAAEGTTSDSPDGEGTSEEPTGTDEGGEEYPDETFESDQSSVHEFRLTATAGDESAAGTVTLRRASQNVTRHEIEADWLHGEWWEPAGEGPHPPVLLLHGSGGEPVPTYAATLASHGYAALTIQYFGTDDLPTELAEVPLEYVMDSIGWFLERAAVAGEEIGVWGGSKGAELALLLASQDDRVAAAISDSGTGYVLAGVTRGFENQSSWAIDGEPVPFLPYPSGSDMGWRYEDGAQVLRGVYANMVEDADRETRKAAEIPVEEGSARYLLLSGADDQMWPAADLSAVAIDRLDAADYDHHYEHQVYENAGHAIGMAPTPDAWAPARNGTTLGGTQSGRGKAAADAWPRIHETLDAALGD